MAKKTRKLLVAFNLPSIFRVGPVRFYPGVNEITQEQWDAIKDHPLLQKRFEVKDLEWVKGGKDSSNDPAAGGAEAAETEAESGSRGSLSSYSAKDACDVVAMTYSVDVLESWLGSENRGGVVKEIKKQIMKMRERDGEEGHEVA